MRFCTLFLKTENVHLMKDVGQLPFVLRKKFNYDAYIATYQNGEYPYLDNEVKGLKLHFVSKSILGKIFDGLVYLYKMRNSIDVLNVYHLNLSSFFWLIFFKMIKKKNAVAYLKLDADHFEIEKMGKKDLRAMIKKITINCADIVSAETTVMQDTLQKYCRIPIIYLPNGYLLNDKDNLELKENRILTVGRLGTNQKATEILVNSFREIYPTIGKAWKLVLVGEMTEGFEKWLNEVIEMNPELQENIDVRGAINNKDELNKQYECAKIFVLPSRYESFGIVLVEAMIKGCYVITTDKVLAAKDLIKDKSMGEIIEVDSIHELSNSLKSVIQQNRDWNAISKKISESVKIDFSWERILISLDKEIHKIRGC